MHPTARLITVGPHVRGGEAAKSSADACARLATLSANLAQDRSHTLQKLRA